MIAYNVYATNNDNCIELIDTVYFQHSLHSETVKEYLIQDDCYEDIIVTRVV